MRSTVTGTRDPVCPFARDSADRIQIVDQLITIQSAPVSQVLEHFPQKELNLGPELMKSKT